MSKYISSKTETGSASVAKWGFTVSTKTNKLFGEEYVAGLIPETTATGATLSAKADSTGRKIVAPGHSGSMTFTIAGSAEVKAQVKISVTEGYKDIVLNYKKGETAGTYNPVVWTLTKKGVTDHIAQGTLENIVEKLPATATYNVGDAAINDEYTISWAWAFENGKDELDTLLGWTASETPIPTDYGFTVEAGTNTSIAFTLNISVEQVMA